MAKLIRKAVKGCAIYVHPSGVYQVFRGRPRPSKAPAFTSHDLTRALAWRAERCR